MHQLRLMQFRLACLLALCLGSPALAVEVFSSDALKLDLSGFVAAQAVYDSNGAALGNHLIGVGSQDSTGKAGFAFDATRLNLKASVPVRDWTAAARLEVDLYGKLRLRHAYTELSNGKLQLLLGQTDTLVGNMVGPSLFNNDWFWAQGNAYDRMFQLRVAYRGGPLLIGAAVVPSVLKATSPAPHVQVRGQYEAKSGLRVGLAGHVGVTGALTVAAPTPADPNAVQAVSGLVPSYLASADASIPLGPVTISAQGWYGAAAAHGTGGGQDLGGPLFTLDAASNGIAVPAAGGFLDVLLKPTPALSLGAAGGLNWVLSSDPTYPVRSNVTAGAYGQYEIARAWTGAVEVQWARTARLTGIGNDVRVLVGTKYAF
jgi:hypothetical protein